MCRWFAYAGPPVLIHDLLYKPHHSLIAQALESQEGKTHTNGDGFGLGWFAEKPTPGLYRDILPAWNDSNLRDLADQIRSHLFFAHVRASTGTATSRENCHPFRADAWLFMHNGQVGGWDQVRRAIDAKIPDDLYPHRHGTTDSEAFFLLALAEGLNHDPVGAVGRAIHHVEAAMADKAVRAPFRMTAAMTNGRRTVIVRHSSDGRSPSLYIAEGAHAYLDGQDLRMAEGTGCVMVMSEPVEGEDLDWTPIRENQIIVIEDGTITASDLGETP